MNTDQRSHKKRRFAGVAVVATGLLALVMLWSLTDEEGSLFSPRRSHGDSAVAPGTGRGPSPGDTLPGEDEGSVEGAGSGSKLGQTTGGSLDASLEVLGGRPLDGDLLLKTGEPGLNTLAGILRDAGATPEDITARLWFAHRFVLSLGMFQDLIRVNEQRIEEEKAAIAEGRPDSSSAIRNWETLRRLDETNLEIYQDYVRRALALDFGITNEAVAERLFDLAQNGPRHRMADDPKSLPVGRIEMPRP